MPAAAIALDLGHDVQPPTLPDGLFGAPRYTAEQQAADPDLPMTRVIKDFLHVGTIRVHDEESGRDFNWNVTEEHLRAIADAHAVARSRGYATNLGKGHGDESTRLIHFDDQIAPIHEIKVGNGAAWLSAYVTPAQAAELSKPSAKVSPYIKAGYRDTGGHVYPLRAVHVGVVDNPRVPGQGRFLVALCDPATGREVSMSSRNAAKHPLFSIALAEGDTPPEELEVEGGSSELTGEGVDTLLEQVGELLQAAYGLALPDGTDGTNLVDRLGLILNMAAQMTGEAEVEEEVVEAPVGAGVPMSQGLRGKLRKPAAPARRPAPAAPTADAIREAEERGQRKAAFSFALEQAANEGVSVADLDRYRRLGERVDYDLSLIPGLPQASIPMGDPLKGVRRTTTPPTVSRTPPKRSAEERRKETNRILRRPV